MVLALIYMNKFIKLILIAFKKRCVWKVKLSEICIFDKTGSQYLTNILLEYKVSVLNVREEIYIKYLFVATYKLFVNRFEYDAYLEYYSSIIDAIQPKVVITYIDNNRTFWKLDRKYSDLINFIAIQNGARFFSSKKNNKSYVDHMLYNLKDKVYHSNFICISSYDVDLYNRNNTNIQRFYPIGVLSASDYIENYIELDNLFELCLVANSINDKPVNHKIMQYFLKYVEKYNISACVALKRSYMSEDFMQHMDIFDKYFGGTRIHLIPNNEIGISEIKMKNRVNRNKKIPSSQYLSDVSNVTIGFASTLLRQSFSRGNKIYPINFETKDLDPPFDLMNITLNPDYESFENNLNELRLIKDSVYRKNHKELMKYLDVFDLSETPDKKLKKIIDDFFR